VNYRHHYHAGNFADVMKHVFLVAIVRALQEKPKGLLLLDTHAGRGDYDLAAAAAGDSRPRQPEHPLGIGLLAARAEAPGEAAPPPAVREYLRLVRAHAPGGERYPGSPQLLARLARPQDRLFLCELQPDEFAALRRGLGRRPQVSVQPVDGYTSLRSVLPPPERRGMILIDPPFEALEEWQRLRDALTQGVNRFPSGTFVIWHPVTARADADRLGDDLAAQPGPPAWSCRLLVAPEAEGMRGCGLIIINPPWTFMPEAPQILKALGRLLRRNQLGETQSRWLRRES
jgi:23S rRNA (adenine2030-N6)-methyltransferase